MPLGDVGGSMPLGQTLQIIHGGTLIKWNSPFRPVSTHFYSCNAMCNQSKTRASALVALLRA